MDPALLQALGSGSLAVALGFAVQKLWAKLNALQMHYEGDPNDQTGTRVGLIRKMEADARLREKDIRSDYDKLLKDERDKNFQLMTDIDATMKKILGEE